MKYKAVIFDLDGTLVHTAPEYRYKVVGDTLKEMGVDSYLKEYVDRLWFESDREKIVREYFGQDPVLFWKIYTKNEKAEVRKKYIKLYNDIDFLTYIRAKGRKTGVVTGSPENIVDLEIEKIGKEKFNSVIVARGFGGLKAKPDPEGLEKCLESLCISKHEAVFVGNAAEDTLAARSAGIMDVFLERGEYEFDLKKLKPSIVINSLYNLKILLDF